MLLVVLFVLELAELELLVWLDCVLVVELDLQAMTAKKKSRSATVVRERDGAFIRNSRG
jgi:hypothetical protein